MMFKKLKIKEKFFIAQILGWLGTLPFFICIFFTLFYLNIDFKAREIGIAYSAIILSFLGAVHWGLLFEKIKEEPKIFFWRWLWGVAPSLIGWLGLSIMIIVNSYKIASIILSLGYVATFIFDYKVLSGYQWYKKLRVYLTIIALLSTLIIGFK